MATRHQSQSSGELQQTLARRLVCQIITKNMQEVFHLKRGQTKKESMKKCIDGMSKIQHRRLLPLILRR